MQPQTPMSPKETTLAGALDVALYPLLGRDPRSHPSDLWRFVFENAAAFANRGDIRNREIRQWCYHVVVNYANRLNAFLTDGERQNMAEKLASVIIASRRAPEYTTTLQVPVAIPVC